MEKYISYEKLSKTEKRKLDNAKRGTWCELNPVTQKPAAAAKPSVLFIKRLGALNINIHPVNTYFKNHSESLYYRSIS